MLKPRPSFSPPVCRHNLRPPNSNPPARLVPSTSAWQLLGWVKWVTCGSLLNWGTCFYLWVGFPPSDFTKWLSFPTCFPEIPEGLVHCSLYNFFKLSENSSFPFPKWDLLHPLQAMGPRATGSHAKSLNPRVLEKDVIDGIHQEELLYFYLGHYL